MKKVMKLMAILATIGMLSTAAIAGEPNPDDTTTEEGGSTSTPNEVDISKIADFKIMTNEDDEEFVAFVAVSDMSWATNCGGLGLTGFKVEVTGDLTLNGSFTSVDATEDWSKAGDFLKAGDGAECGVAFVDGGEVKAGEMFGGIQIKKGTAGTIKLSGVFSVITSGKEFNGEVEPVAPFSNIELAYPPESNGGGTTAPEVTQGPAPTNAATNAATNAPATTAAASATAAPATAAPKGGVALAVIPTLLAAGAAVVATKKRK